MWKIIVGFTVFAGLALFVISQGGDSLDMSGEKHGADAVHVPAPAEASAIPAVAPAETPAATPATAPATAPAAPASK